MEVNREALEEFKALYEEEFGPGLTDQEALQKARAVLDLFTILFRPIPDANRISRKPNVNETATSQEKLTE